MQTIPMSRLIAYKNLCLYKSSVRTDCVTTPSEALFRQYCTVGSSLLLSLWLSKRQLTEGDRHTIITLKSAACKENQGVSKYSSYTIKRP